MSDEQTSGMGFASWLCLAFIVLKLLGHITWSWWWVLAPLWIPFASIGAILAFCGIGWVICTGIEIATKGSK